MRKPNGTGWDVYMGRAALAGHLSKRLGCDETVIGHLHVRDWPPTELKMDAETFREAIMEQARNSRGMPAKQSGS